MDSSPSQGRGLSMRWGSRCGIWFVVFTHTILGFTEVKKTCRGTWLVVMKPFERVYETGRHTDLLANLRFSRSPHPVQYMVDRFNRPKYTRLVKA